MKLNAKAVGLSFLVTLAIAAIAHAITTSEIWAAWYDSTNTAIRVNIVGP